jgi:hypothetical protein
MKFLQLDTSDVAQGGSVFQGKTLTHGVKIAILSDRWTVALEHYRPWTSSPDLNPKKSPPVGWLYPQGANFLLVNKTSNKCHKNASDDHRRDVPKELCQGRTSFMQYRRERFFAPGCVRLRLLFRSSTIRVHVLHKRLAFLAGEQKIISRRYCMGELAHSSCALISRRIQVFSRSRRKNRENDQQARRDTKNYLVTPLPGRAALRCDWLTEACLS